MALQKKIILLCLTLMICNICFGQIDSVKEDQSVRRMYILKFDNKPTLITEYAYIDPKYITNMDVLSSSSLKELKARLQVDDILILSLERQIKLLTFQDVLELYKIQKHKSKWILKVDDDFVEYPGTMVISGNQIEKVICRNNYIHIILKDYYQLKKKYKNAKIIYR
jgi:hypothetical protein